MASKIGSDTELQDFTKPLDRLTEVKENLRDNEINLETKISIVQEAIKYVEVCPKNKLYPENLNAIVINNLQRDLKALNRQLISRIEECKDRALGKVLDYRNDYETKISIVEKAMRDIDSYQKPEDARSQTQIKDWSRELKLALDNLNSKFQRERKVQEGLKTL